MISAKKLIKLARKWQKLAAMKRKRITFLRTGSGDVDTNSCSTSSSIEKGHFVVYSADEKRFVLPLEYLENKIVIELFKLAEDEFGLPSNGHLTFTCDAAFMEYVIGLIKRKASQEVEKALLMSVVTGRCSSSSYLCQQETSNQLPIRVFKTKYVFNFVNDNTHFVHLRYYIMRKLDPDFVSWLVLETLTTSSVVEKGHFVVYSVDQKRFVVPLEYLKNEIVMELFNLAEEEFRLSGNGLLIFPCDATFMEYVIALI